MSCSGAYLTIAHALSQKHSYLWFRGITSVVFFHMVRAGTNWHKIHDIHACAFTVQTKYLVTSFGFLFWRLLRRHCKIFNINAEKPKFYSSTVVYFTLANLLVYTGEPLKNQLSPRGQVQGLSLVHFDPMIHLASVYFDEK